MLKLIDRYIFREILTPFSLTLGTLLLVLLTDQILRLVELFINKGVPFFTIIKILVWILPTFLVIAIPVGVLIGVIIAFNRLSTDSEIIALQTTGVSLYRLLWPAIIFSSLAFVLTFTLSVWGQPWAGHSLKNLGISIVKQQASVALEPGVFNEPFKKMIIYVDQMPNSENIKGILIYDSRNSKVPVLTLAKEGILINDPENNSLGFRLINGSQYRFSKNKSGRQQIIQFGSYDFRLNIDSALGRQDLLKNRLNPEDLRKAIINEPDQADSYRRLLSEYYKNYAFPFSCLIFGLIGVPIGVAVRRAGRLGGFTVGLSMAVIYYILIIMADFLVISDTVNPVFAAWLPNLIMVVITLLLIILSNKGSSGLLVWMRKE
jgi:lipopolysaccharide export system permease protein